MGDLSVKLSIRGAAAAPKMSQLTVALNINGKSTSGTVQWTLKDVISNEIVKAKNGAPSVDVNVSSSGYSSTFNLGEFFDTPRTGAYILTATLNGEASNTLPLKILL